MSLPSAMRRSTNWRDTLSSVAASAGDKPASGDAVYATVRPAARSAITSLIALGLLRLQMASRWRTLTQPVALASSASS